MNVPAVLAGVTLGGLAIGGGIGAVQSLRQDPTSDGLTTGEARNAAATGIIGLGVGVGAGLIGARTVLPMFTGFGGALAGGLLGASALGGYSLAKSALD